MSKYKLHIATKGTAAFEQFVELPDIPEQREAFLMALKSSAKKNGWLTMQSNDNHMSVRNECISHFMLEKVVTAPKISPEDAAKLQAEINEKRINPDVQETIPFPAGSEKT